MSDVEITPLQQLAYDIIVEILDAKRGTIEPCVAHINEIRKSIDIELMEALRELYRRKILSCHIDVCKNPMFAIKNPL